MPTASNPMMTLDEIQTETLQRLERDFELGVCGRALSIKAKRFDLTSSIQILNITAQAMSLRPDVTGLDGRNMPAPTYQLDACSRSDFEEFYNTTKARLFTYVVATAYAQGVEDAQKAMRTALGIDK